MAEPRSEDSREAAHFLQRRVKSFARFGTYVVFGFLAYRVVFEGLTAHPDADWLLKPVFTLHFLAGVALLVLWLSCRGRHRPPGTVRRLEALCLLGCGTCLIGMGTYIPAFVRPDLITIAALNAAFVARAVYVPSSARRTGLFGGVLAVPLLIGVYTIYVNVDPQKWAVFEPNLARTTARAFAWTVTIDAAAWWTTSVVIMVAASRVIYGLRREVREIKKLGQYQLESKLGAGGMGVVYRARHAMLRRPTAIKLLPPKKAGEKAVLRFEREVQQTARLTHPNTVTIFDYGRTPAGVFYYAMELLDGLTLERIVQQDGPLPPERVVHVVAQVAGALAEAHEMGLIHRDIKPANIMLCRAGGMFDVTKVLDFGLVKELEHKGAVELTNVDAITGTPQYLAPESLISPDAVDGRADIYALGAVVYYLLTGHEVFEGGSLIEVCSHHLHTAPVPPSERLGRPIPAELETLVLDCLKKDPAERPQSARELVRRAARLAGSEGVPVWSQEHAERWWTAHAELVAPSTTASISETIEVDLRGRKPRKRSEPVGRLAVSELRR